MKKKSFNFTFNTQSHFLFFVTGSEGKKPDWITFSIKLQLMHRYTSVRNQFSEDTEDFFDRMLKLRYSE